MTSYISLPAMPDASGRTLRDACTDPITGAYVCAVDEVLEGDTEISADEHAAIVAAAKQYAIDHPPVVADPPVLQPTPFEQLVTALAAEPALSQDTKATIMAITGGADVAIDVPLVPRKA